LLLELTFRTDIKKMETKYKNPVCII